MTDAEGRVLGLVGVSRDITEEKKLEEALRESERRFRTMADNIAQLAWMADGSGRVFWYNKRWFEYTGMTFVDMQESDWTVVHHPEHVDRVVQSFFRCVEQGEVWEDTFPIRAVDGTYRWFLSRAVPVRDGRGEIVCWFGTKRT